MSNIGEKNKGIADRNREPPSCSLVGMPDAQGK